MMSPDRDAEFSVSTLPRRLLLHILLLLALSSFASAQNNRAHDSEPNRQTDNSQLVQSLISAQTDVERERLLQSAPPEALSVELRRALIAAGDVAKTKEDYATAQAAYASARLLAKRIGDRGGVALALAGMGQVSYFQGDGQGALALLQQSQKIDARAVEPSFPAKVLFSVGAGYFARGEYDMAMDFYRQSLDVYEKNGGTKDDIAGSLYGIGAIYYLKGDFNTALEYHERCLRLAQETGDQVSLAYAFFGLAADNRMKGDYVSALEFYEKSLALFEQLVGKRSEVYARAVTTILRHIGTTYFLQGNYRLALNYYERCLQRDEAGKDAQGIANSLMYIGGVYRAQGRFAQALEYLEKAERLFEQLEHKSEIAHTLNLIGNVYQQQNNPHRAQAYFERALALNEKIAANEAIASTLVNLANVQSALGADAQSVATATRAAEISRRIGSPHTLWSALLNSGKSLRALGNLDAARLALDESIRVIESMRTHVAGGEENQELFFADKVAPYYAMVDLLAASDKPDEAFAYAERAKARVLLDALQHGRPDAVGQMTHTEQAQDKKLKGELTTLGLEFTREQSRRQPDLQQLANLKARVEGARNTYAAFQTALMAAHPALRLRRGEAQSVTSQDAAALMTNDQTALVEYVVTDERTYLFVFTRGGGAANTPREQPFRGNTEWTDSGAQPRLQVYSINIKRAELSARIQRFRQQLAERNLLFRPDASALYKLLLQPASEQLHSKTRLIIVPDDGLWELPFQALQPTEDSYLVEQCAISYAPSLAVLREMRRARKEHPRPAANQPTLLALGDPALGRHTIERANAALVQAATGNAPAPLPEAERQVRALAQLYGARSSRVYTGAAASEARLKREAPSYSILHLATHGTLDNLNPMYSYVMLAQDSGNPSPEDRRGAAREDGLLQAWELMDMRLDADLVVLSACETARGEIKSGEGVIGLSWALFVAGCPTSVVSQWKIESASTTELMLQFHRRLHASLVHTRSNGTISNGTSKAESLRRASLALLHSDKYSHPFYWAGFVMIGDGD